MSDEVIGSSGEATRGGFFAVRKVTGLFSELKRVDSKFDPEQSKFEPKDQVQVTLEDALILEMEEGEPEPELRDGKYVFWMNYAKKGQTKPHANTFFVKGFCKSAEEIQKARGKAGGGWRDFLDQAIVLEKQSVLLFKRRKDGTDPDNPEYDEFYQEGFVFVDETAAEGDLSEHVKELIVGKNKQAALRAVLTDNRAKRNPEYKEAINSGAICELVGVYIDDAGLYQWGEA